MGCCLGEDANLAAAPLAQSLFFRPGERRPPMGRRRHTMAVEALVPPDATRVATRIAAHSPTVYTDGQKRRRKAVFADLCTLLHPHGLLARPSRCNSVHKWQKTVSRGHSRRLVYTVASPRLSTTTQQRNSVHKRPNPARRGPILPFVYTIAIPRPPTTQAHSPNSVHKCPETAPRGHFHRSVYTPASSPWR